MTANPPLFTHTQQCVAADSEEVKAALSLGHFRRAPSSAPIFHNAGGIFSGGEETRVSIILRDNLLHNNDISSGSFAL